MPPELPRAPLSTATVAARAVALLQREAPQWTVELPGARSSFAQLFWRNPPPADGSVQSGKQMFGEFNPIRLRDRLHVNQVVSG
ncbi:hypothetical protein KHF85_10100 [Xanthomonas translucens pv. graminis]|uniref:hypothetical protein n=1 Tax=Xanthomonas graminis TaxID=3390026 RepID=UPI00253FA82C|nr:hypothetical protein [Xanthomonas translucens]WIH03304.1 hypothetical protein KHF85_10100 [Xanthomonas translucens pv. graminis]